MEEEQKNNQEQKENGVVKKTLFFAGLLFVWELVKIVVIAAVIVLPIRYFLFQPFIVSGESMSPNFESGDYLIVDEITYRFSSPQRGDVVVFNTDFIQGYRGQRFIKRIIGLPGETIQIQNGKVDVLRDGKSVVLNEKYLSNTLQTDGNINVTLGSDQYFVMGDNRQYSYDSRRWGILPRQYIIGKALFRVFPLANIAALTTPSYSH
jgi:signal peptidase I